METLLLAFGGCDGINVVTVLRKMRQDVTGYQVRLHADRRDETPRVFTAVRVEHVVRGREVDSNAVRRAIALSAKYCSVGTMLRQVVPVSESFRLLDESTGAEVAGGAVEAEEMAVEQTAVR
jgi:putative redox protein